MSSVPFVGGWPWRALSTTHYPKGPFRLWFMDARWELPVPGARLDDEEQADRTCALLNIAHEIATERVKQDIRKRLGL